MLDPDREFELKLNAMVDAEIQDWYEELSDFGSSVEPEQLEFDSME